MVRDAGIDAGIAAGIDAGIDAGIAAVDNDAKQKIVNWHGII